MRMLDWFLHGAIALLVAMAGFAVKSVHEQAPAEVTVSIFPGGFNFAEFCGAGERFFRAQRHQSDALRTGMDRFQTLLTEILAQFGPAFVTCS